MRANITRATVSGDTVTHDVSGAEIVVSGTVQQTGATAPTIEAAEGWELTTPGKAKGQSQTRVISSGHSRRQKPPRPQNLFRRTDTMLSEMAAEDIKYLEGLGVTLTPGQIVRLNDLALRVTHGKASADFLHAPRVAWIGTEHVFHEPTIAMCMWLRDYASQWWSGDKMLIATAWASSQCRVRGVFDRYTEKTHGRARDKKVAENSCLHRTANAGRNHVRHRRRRIKAGMPGLTRKTY